MGGFKLPDVTLPQVLAVIGWIVAQAVSMGFIDSNTGQFIVQISATGLAAAWVIGDAIIRHGRAKIAAAAISARTRP